MNKTLQVYTPTVLNLVKNILFAFNLLSHPHLPHFHPFPTYTAYGLRRLQRPYDYSKSMFTFNILLVLLDVSHRNV